MKELICALAMLVMLSPGLASAAHPLITDDAGTQGKDKAQLEFTGEFGHDNEAGMSVNTATFPTIPVLSYGLSDTVDIVLGVPFERTETEQGGTMKRQRGAADASLQLKWRFFDSDGVSFAVKAGITAPTGDERKGLGTGKTSYNAFFIATKNSAPWAFHFNAGYLRNEYKLHADQDANRNDLWHVSLASQVDIARNVKAVVNIGMQRNADKTSNTDPAFLLGGIIYSLQENLDLDCGVKYGLNKPETDRTYLVGITWRL